PFFIEDQTRLVINTLNAFRNTRNFERTTPDINIEEIENDSDDYYSETRHSEKNEENLINNNLFEEQGTPPSQYQTQTPTPEPEEDEMANIDTVLNTVNQLTNANLNDITTVLQGLARRLKQMETTSRPQNGGNNQRSTWNRPNYTLLAEHEYLTDERKRTRVNEAGESADA
ncbi:1661_t:CDS:2, partial [Ambispora gerdemannii]